jgi:acyltransferase
MTTETASIPARERPSSTRVLLVDLLRLLALFQMVNGHTLDAVMAASEREGPGFARYNFFRGLVSVSFMLASGVAFHLTTLSRLSGKAPEGTRKRVGRMVEIIAIGYALRFPLGAWSDDPEVVGASWRRLAEIDVLQVIGVSLLLLEGLAHVLRDRRRVEIATAALVLVFVAVSPLMELTTSDLPWSFLTGWLGHGSGSIFPLFPWGAYVFAGATLAAVAFPEGGRTPARRIVIGLAAATVVTSAITFVLWRTPYTFWVEPASYHSMPAFFFEKLAWVLGALAVLAPVMSRVRALPGPIAVLAQETLPVYVFHLLVLFFPPMMLAARLGQDLTLREAGAVSLGMIVLCATFGLVWPRLRGAVTKLKQQVFRSAPAAVIPPEESPKPR